MNKYIISIFVVLTGFVIFVVFDGNRFPNDKNIDILPLKKFAQNFCNKKCSSLPDIPTELKMILTDRVIDDEYKSSVSLIYLKLFASQLNQYKQSFQIKEPFSTKEHILLKSFRKFGSGVISEFITADIGYLWICHQKDFLHKYKEVSKVCHQIELQYKIIENL